MHSQRMVSIAPILIGCIDYLAYETIFMRVMFRPKIKLDVFFFHQKSCRCLLPGGRRWWHHTVLSNSTNFFLRKMLTQSQNASFKVLDIPNDTKKEHHCNTNTMISLASYSSLTLFALSGLLISAVSSYVVESPLPIAPSKHGLWTIPPISSSTCLTNEFYSWCGQQIRYLVSGPANAKKSALLIHGLFVNADHWRRTINELGDAGYCTCAIDLLGSGYSSKPNAYSVEA